METITNTIAKMVVLITMAMMASCSSEELAKRECNLSSINGHWDWIETTGGVSGVYLTPNNTGFTMRLEINDTIWSEYLNDSLTSSIHYSFTPDTNSNFLEGRVYFSNSPGIPIRITNCSMTIEGIFEDSMNSTYEYKE